MSEYPLVEITEKRQELKGLLKFLSKQKIRSPNSLNRSINIQYVRAQVEKLKKEIAMLELEQEIHQELRAETNSNSELESSNTQETSDDQ